jgi:hypothetical protein
MDNNFWFKDYFVMFERQHNGSIRVVASNDYDSIREVFYDYSIKEIISKIKSDIRYRLAQFS